MRQKIWFKKWVSDKRTLQSLSRDSGKSTDTLRRLFRIFLTNPPEAKIKLNDSCNLIIDGTYVDDFCAVDYFDDGQKYLQLCSVMNRENYDDIAADLSFLKWAGLNIASITSDGHKSLIKAIKEVLPNVIHQRCIIHIQRMSRIYLTQFPKTEAGRELLPLVGKLHEITTYQERDGWIKMFHDWCDSYYDFLSAKSISPSGRKWYTHKLLRRTRSLIKNALPDMFHYLDDQRIPKSTNGLECRFSYLKNELKIHRGLSTKNRKNFILWYSYFKYNL